MDLSLRPSFFFSFLVFIFLLKKPDLGSASNSTKCISTERQALLTFKQSLTDPFGRLSSWSGPDCCNWRGILCDSRTSHVIKIDLRNPNQTLRPYDYYGEFQKGGLGGKINPSLTRLKFLSYLDLSSNDFKFLKFPEFIGRIVSLRYLNLSFTSLSGEVPASFGNLSKLESLDLYAQTFSNNLFKKYLHASNLGWLSGLSSSLTYLNLGFVNLSGAGETWLRDFSRLSKLKELHLSNCELTSLPLSLPSNLKLLEVLDLSQNSLYSPIPSWLFDLTNLRNLFLQWVRLQGSIPPGFKKLQLLETLVLSSNELSGEVPAVLGDLPQLKHLDLSQNSFQGQIHRFLDALAKNKGNNLLSLRLNFDRLEGTLPESLGELRNLEILELTGNSFTDSIPSTVGNMASLKKLDLSYNAMNGKIPESLGKLEELVDLNLMENKWEGVLLQSHFVNLRSLKSFSLRTEPNRSVIFKVPSTWVPPFRLELINIENCQIGPSFPMWLQVQNKLNSVTLRNTGIADKIPHSWFSRIASDVTQLYLENNRITGTLPQNLVFPNLAAFDLSSNNFQGPFPSWTTNAAELCLYQNNFSGPLPPDIDVLMPRVRKINLFHNSFNGEIPPSLCQLTGLEILNLRNNCFSGSFPNCWRSSSQIYEIDASENNISGMIPESLSVLPRLFDLLLNQNALEGNIPETFQNCSSLKHIHLGGNKLTGKIPSWLSKLSSLSMLRLQSNSFDGQIPDDLCSAPSLHILDLSENKLSDLIPKCIGNLTAIVQQKSVDEYYEYQEIRDSINLSGNNINGEIPGEILDLTYLRILNLSRNSIAGSIPGNISKLGHLETLDLSSNKFSGAIPQSLSAISSLHTLNLSYNKLEGRIPKNLKFKDPSIYIGNELLCGKPLPEKCPRKQQNVCCKWRGVLCDHRTSHVIKIDLRNPNQTLRLFGGFKEGSLGGKLHPSLTRLKFLTYLDLSSNDFNFLEIPEFIGRIVSLRHLNLSFSSFSGEVPASLGNLWKLESLDLYAQTFRDDGPASYTLRASNLGWLSGLSSSLTYLNMGFKLKELHLFNCELKSLPLSFSLSANLKLLEVLDLSRNSFSSPIPNWLFDLTNLRKLYIQWVDLQGPISSGFKKFQHLETLDLSYNALSQEIPAVLGDLPQLKYLDLRANSFQGQIHRFLDAFSKNKENSLIYLVLGSNGLNGTLPESLGALRNLQILDLSLNSFTGLIPSTVGKMVSLKKLALRFNSMNGKIPESLGKLDRLETLDLSLNRFSGAIPQSLAAISSLKKLDLSYNKLEGRIPKNLKFKDPSIYIGNELLCGKPLPKKCPRKQQNAVAN
ncbi:hypothetical protein Bca101_017550 [Brassica carinata]